MGQFKPNSLYIASIYPGRRERIIKPFGPTMHRSDGTSTSFELKPVKKGGKPYVIEVPDMFQHSKDPLKTANQGKQAFSLDPVPCEEIAAELVRVWGENIPDLPFGAGPGIMILIGTTPQQHEVETMKAMLQAYCEHYFLDGERIARDVGMHGINAEHKLAADYLERPRNWSHPGRALEMIPCPLCKKAIAADSIICGECGTRLKEVPKQYADLNPQLAQPVEA